jgi:hypothetical protein
MASGLISGAVALRQIRSPPMRAPGLTSMVSAAISALPSTVPLMTTLLPRARSSPPTWPANAMVLPAAQSQSLICAPAATDTALPATTA